MKIEKILKAADPDNVQWLIVELDNCDTDIMKAVKESHAWLVNHDFGMTVG